MTLRPTQSSTYRLVQAGLSSNLAKLVRAQEQVSSGKRILRPSDDPTGSARATSLKELLAGQARFSEALAAGRALLDSGASALESGSTLLTEARALALEGMNGTLSPADRAVLADQLELVRDQLIEVANARSGSRYLFGGTSTQSAPFVEKSSGGHRTVSYAGNSAEPEIQATQDARLGTGLPGAVIFDKSEPTGTRYAGLIGAAAGSSADQGSGFTYVEAVHDATSGTLGAGLAFAAGGALDTILGAHTLVVDPLAGTVQLDGGAPVALPAPSSSAAADFRVVNERGAELHLDFTAYDGTPVNAALTGSGRITLDGVNYTPLAFADPNLRLTDASGTVLHVDETGIDRAGRELVTFGGEVSAFDVLEGLILDLRNADGLAQTDLAERVGERLVELDRAHGNLLAGQATLGSRSARAASLEARFEDAKVHVQDLLSRTEDADLGQVILEMSRASSTLETAQATSARLLQTTLLNFLR